MNKQVYRPFIFRLVPGVIMLAAFTLASSSCNDKKDDPEDDTETIVNLPNVAVTAFNLKADSKVMENIDSVFFSIDLENGVIFNADSLPKGTSIDKLVANIKYSSSITSASIVMEGGTTRTGTVDYIANPGDSIDFTGSVKLLLATDKEEMKKTYTIKVNVHRQEPDSLVWNEVALASLPSRLGNPSNQKTVDINGKAVSLIEEKDGSLTLAVSDNLYDNTWTKAPLSLPFSPDIRSLAASDDALYLLDTAGTLYTSRDGSTWQSTGENWNRIIGGYIDTVIGLRTDSDGLVYAQYPQKDLDPIGVDPDFPVNGLSNFVTHTNKWTSSPVGFFCGGEKADGSLSDSAWAFDGAVWINLSQGGFPPLKGASLVPYYAFRNTSTSSITPTELEAWMIIGGEKTDHTFNRVLYISYDNGVNWRQGDKLLQLPSMIPPMTECDNIVLETKKHADLADAWKVMDTGRPAKVKWEVDNNIITWECPYIYLIGGFDSDLRLCDTIWRGVINRLQSTPII